jgi:hypothetical protein
VKNRYPLIALILFIGLFCGSVFGDIVSHIVPAGAIKSIFFESVGIGLKDPLKLDLSFLSIVLGGVLRVNFFSLLGLLIAAIFAYRIKK